MEIMGSPCVLAKRRSSSKRAMSVGSSSETISHSAPTGVLPASRARSTAASVWPGRSSTPPALARRGTTWPGRVNDEALAEPSASKAIVVARERAEMPVVPVAASTVTA